MFYLFFECFAVLVCTQASASCEAEAWVHAKTAKNHKTNKNTEPKQKRLRTCGKETKETPPYESSEGFVFGHEAAEQLAQQLAEESLQKVFLGVLANFFFRTI